MTIVYRSVKGSDLTANEIDGNFHDIDDRVTDIETNPPSANGISSIDNIGGFLYLTLADGQVLGPVAYPIAVPRWRGDWVDGASYTGIDLVDVPEVGLFLCLADGTSHGIGSPPAFDPSETTGSPPTAMWLKIFGFSGTSSGLGDLVNTDVESPADGDIIAYEAASSFWKNIQRLRPTAKTADYTVLSTDNHKSFNDSGAAGDVNFDLPAAAIGMRYSFVKTDLGSSPEPTLSITANGTDRVHVGALASSAGGMASTATPYSTLTLECHETGVWVVAASVGAWDVA